MNDLGEAKNRASNAFLLARFLATPTNCEILSERGDGERQDEQKRLTNERHLTKFFVSSNELARHDAGFPPLLAVLGTPRNFPVEQTPIDRGSQRAEVTTLRLRVADLKPQAKKEIVR